MFSRWTNSHVYQAATDLLAVVGVVVVYEGEFIGGSSDDDEDVGRGRRPILAST